MRGALVDIRLAPAAVSESRIGVIVPRYGFSAVDRNRVKRRLRELVRREWISHSRGTARDIVIRALPAAYRATFDALRSELDVLRDKAGA
jgi:ribonuclease P protein component